MLLSGKQSRKSFIISFTTEFNVIFSPLVFLYKNVNVSKVVINLMEENCLTGSGCCAVISGRGELSQVKTTGFSSSLSCCVFKF